MKDYYAVLGVPRDATSEEIKTAYRQMMLQHHPDRAGGSHERSSELNVAYEELSDKFKRQAHDYDLSGKPLMGLSLDFRQLNIVYRFVPNPDQYNHYDFWNLMFARDERFHITPQTSDHARWFLAHLALFIMGEIQTQYCDDMAINTYRKKLPAHEFKVLARANHYKLIDLRRALFEIGSEAKKELYDHYLGETLTDEALTALIETMGGAQALAEAIAVNPSVEFYYPFSVLAQHQLLTPKLAKTLLQVSNEPIYPELLNACGKANFPEIRLSDFHSMFVDLAKQGLLNVQTIDLLIRHRQKIDSFGPAIGILGDNKVLTQETLEFLISLPQKAHYTAHMWTEFLEADLWNDDLWQAIKQQRIWGSIYHQLREMTEDGIITDEARQAVKWQGPEVLRPLNRQVHELLIHGAHLLHLHQHQKGKTVFQLALELKIEIKAFWQQPLAERKANFDAFKQRIADKLAANTPTLAFHRDPWFVIKANILTALTGIGLLLMGMNYALTGQFCLFKTASEYKANAAYAQLHRLCKEDNTTLVY